MTADFSRASDRRSISNNLVEFVFFAGTKIWTCEPHFVLCFRWWRCVLMFVVFTANVDNHRKYLTDKSFFRWGKKKEQQQIPFHKKCQKVSWPTNGRASVRTPFLLLTIWRLHPLTPEMCVKLSYNQTNTTLCKKNTVPHPSGGSRGGAKLRPEGQKICFLGRAPTGPFRVCMTSPLPSPPYLKVWICYWNKMIFITRLTKSCLRIKSYFKLVSVSIEVLHFSTLSLGMLISHGEIP